MRNQVIILELLLLNKALYTFSDIDIFPHLSDLQNFCSTKKMETKNVLIMAFAFLFCFVLFAPLPPPIYQQTTSNIFHSRGSHIISGLSDIDELLLQTLWWRSDIVKFISNLARSLAPTWT